MPVDFSGTYDSVREENMDEFLKEMGKGMIERKMAKSAKVTLTIVQDGDRLTITRKGPKESKTNTVTVGEEMDFDLPSGETVKGKATWEGDKIVGNCTTPKNKCLEIIRELEGDCLMQTVKYNGITFKRWYKRQ